MTKLSPATAAADHRDLPSHVQHPFHEGHSLKLVPNDDGVKFKCDGCEVRGAGARYECERGAACSLDLHIKCALAPALREIGGNKFVLHHKPPAGGGRRLCDACGGAATGFVYHCAKLDHDVHPCCAGLPETFDLLPGLSLDLEVCMEDDAPPRRCAFCNDKKTKCRWGGRRRVNSACWSYRSVGSCGDDVFLHVACPSKLGCDSFTNVSLGEVMAARASETETVSLVVVDASRVYRSDQEMVQIKASALRALLLKGQGRGHRDRGGGALARSIRVLGFIVRVVIGIISLGTRRP